MKKTVVLIALLVVGIGSVFCQDLMEIKIGSYSIAVPSGWTAVYTDSTTIFTLYSPVEEEVDDFQENVNLVTEDLPSRYTVKAYLKAAQGAIQQLYDDFELQESGDNYHIFSGSLNETMVMQMQFVAIKNNVAYIVTYTSSPESFNRYLKTFKDIQKTFKF